MCIEWFKNLFNEGSDDPIEYQEKNALLYSINKYPNTANNLDGCLNDMYDLTSKCKQFDDKFYIKQFPDSYATSTEFLKRLRHAVDNVDAGTLFIFWMDCCHAESNTKYINNRIISNRFHNPGLPPRKIVAHEILRSKSDMKYISISGCLSTQSSDDAYFSGRANGAFSYCGVNTLHKDMTYKSWTAAINTSLHNFGFEQIAVISGPDDLINRKVFEGKIMFIAYSGHGTYTYDLNGDEVDGYDEALYMYDGMLVDDKIDEIVKDIRL